ncbi:MAG TPA: competence/damage-inducible protein A [Bryobacteraceae bacterium]|nr:competence/damage-inducible protein A [Bryobacteraceae bacterium]
MNAEIIAVGSEMLTPQRVDTNSLWLTAELNDLGIEVIAKTIVGDDRARLIEFIGDATRRSELVILTGGLGPTEDDITRDCAAAATARTLQFSEVLLDDLIARFARFGRKMADNNKRQAYLIEGAEALPNPNGSAPGQWVRLAPDRFLALLPGPPKEMKPMYTAQVLPRLRAVLPPQHIRVLTYRIAGMGESDVDALVAPIYTQYANPSTTILAKPGDVELHFRARCAAPEEAERLLSEIGPQIEALLGDRIYSRDGAALEAAVGAMLRARHATLAVAESCSGGLLAQRITSVAGSSGYFAGGFVVYSRELKNRLLGIPLDAIAGPLIYSEGTASQLAEGARSRTGATYALAIIGVAGPGPDEGFDPGHVVIGLSSAQKTEARTLKLFGDRDRVRFMATQSALDLLRKTYLLAD